MPLWQHCTSSAGWRQCIHADPEAHCSSAAQAVLAGELASMLTREPQLGSTALCWLVTMRPC